MTAAWPKEHMDELKKLSADHLTAGQMAQRMQKLRPGVTRNAVIGQCKRHNISLSETAPSKKRNRVKDGTRERVIQMRPKMEIAALIRPDAWKPVEGSRCISLMARTPLECPWPIGDDPKNASDLICCGAPKDQGAEYCAHHMTLRSAPYTPKLQVGRWAA